MATSTIIPILEMWTGPQQCQGVSWLLNSRIRSRLEDVPLCLGRTSPGAHLPWSARARRVHTALLDPGTGSGSASAKGPARRPGAEEARRPQAAARSSSLPEGRPRRMGSRARRAQSPWGGEQECSCEPRRALPPAQPSIAGPLLSHRRTGSSLPASAEPWPRNCLKARPLHLPTSGPASSPAAKIAGLYNDSEPPWKTMRRGVLMTLLQQSAMTLPLWIGKPGDKPPPLCGAIPASGDYVARPGDKVAARVKAVDGDEQWILAEVVSYSHATNKYEVDDIDEEGKERHTLSRRRVIPLPQWKANPEMDPEALFQKEQLVLALYPQTTCFYRALIHVPPQRPQNDYSVLFEDTSYADGYSPPLNVAQRYVVACKEPKKK
ncbi:SAGA-associated factor 29-like [Gorilla gorilla gorilla]|uniref:SAGA-associated factor 29-like n=1 Tax=Gorilla gorilla gorilla TaxID=9595 RepID=UPI00244635DA|nr:SAGA-associated factor 29-like [Gorilla gorilla gorilla]